MSVMQLPAPNFSAKVIVSIREALLLYEYHAFISHTRWVVCCSFTFTIIIGGLFKLENATTLSCLLKTQISRSSDLF